MDKFTQDQIHELAQRIAGLEKWEMFTKEKLESIEETIESTNRKVDILNNQVANLLGKIAKWEGKFGGVLFVAGCVWTFLVVTWSSIINYVKYVLGIVPNVSG